MLHKRRSALVVDRHPPGPALHGGARADPAPRARPRCRDRGDRGTRPGRSPAAGS